MAASREKIEILDGISKIDGQASWGDIVWRVDEAEHNAIDAITIADSVKTKIHKTNRTVKVTGPNLQTVNLENSIRFANLIDTVILKYRQNLGKSNILYVGGERIGRFILKTVDLLESSIDASGKITFAKVSLQFLESPGIEGTIEGLKIIYSGKEIQDKISIRECVYETHAQGKADSLFIIANDPKGVWDGWNVENESMIELRFKGLKTGKMYITDVSPRAGEIQIEALSIPPTAMQPQSKAWEKIGLKKIAAEIADRHGLETQFFDIDTENHSYISQSNMPDFQFLDMACSLEGASFLVYDKKLIVFDLQKKESQNPLHVIDILPETQLHYSENTENVIKKTVVRNAEHEGVFEIPIEKGRDQTLTITHSIDSPEHANKIAQSMTRRANADCETLTFTLDITPEVAAGSVIEIKTQTAPSWDGPIFITSTRHDFARLETKITARKPLGY